MRSDQPLTEVPARIAKPGTTWARHVENALAHLALSLPQSMRAEPVEARYLTYEPFGGGGRVGVAGRPRRPSAILKSDCGEPATNRG
jgi:hypothetical protein